MASAQQLIGLVKSHAEGDSDRFYDLAMQLSAAEEQKGHTRLADELRQWAEAGTPFEKQKLSQCLRYFLFKPRTFFSIQ